MRSSQQRSTSSLTFLPVCLCICHCTVLVSFYCCLTPCRSLKLTSTFCHCPFACPLCLSLCRLPLTSRIIVFLSPNWIEWSLLVLLAIFALSFYISVSLLLVLKNDFWEFIIIHCLTSQFCMWDWSDIQFSREGWEMHTYLWVEMC